MWPTLDFYLLLSGILLYNSLLYVVFCSLTDSTKTKDQGDLHRSLIKDNWRYSVKRKRFQKEESVYKKSQDTTPVWKATRLPSEYFYKSFFESGELSREWLNLILLCSVPTTVLRWTHAVETPVEGAVSVNVQVRKDIPIQGLKIDLKNSLLKHKQYFNGLFSCVPVIR